MLFETRNYLLENWNSYKTGILICFVCYRCVMKEHAPPFSNTVNLPYYICFFHLKKPLFYFCGYFWYLAGRLMHRIQTPSPIDAAEQMKKTMHICIALISIILLSILFCIYKMYFLPSLLISCTLHQIRCR